MPLEEVLGIGVERIKTLDVVRIQTVDDGVLADLSDLVNVLNSSVACNKSVSPGCSVLVATETLSAMIVRLVS